MGGIGKTTLAKLVFNEIDQFEIKTWVCVSDKFDIPKILQDIVRDTRENRGNCSLDTLVRRLQKELSGKKYFLVLDDLWEDNTEQWEKLKGILDVGGKGSVILITTRIEKVALITQSTTPYNIDNLSDSVCWSIFKNLAFKEGEEETYPRLCEIGVSIVEKCCGIPLVVRCLGSMLRGETEGEWQRIKDMDSLNKLDGQYDRVKQLLKLSYDKLPSHLKSCFAYLSLLPKDHDYDPRFQYFYWSALGLLEHSDGIYFRRKFVNELISRSMIQDPTLYFNGMIFGFKMHDLLHDLAEDVLGEELVVVAKNKLSAPDTSRYVAWGLNFADEEFPEHVKAKKSRAFIFQFEDVKVSHSFLIGIILNMPYLRILDFGGSQFEELPRSIGSLKHLRLLNLSENELIKTLPETLCELLNLECLLLGNCYYLEKIPSEIYKLVSLKFLTLTTSQRSLVESKLNRLPGLRQLVLQSCEELEYIWDSNDAGCLTSLETLWIADCPKMKTLPNSIKLLVTLEELTIVDCEALDLETCGCLRGLRSLKTLHVSGVPQLRCLPNGLLSAANSLQYLWIEDCGGFAELPKWLESFTFLQNLTIWDCPNLLALPEGIFHLKSLQFLQIRGCPHISRGFTTPDGEYLPLLNHVFETELDGCCPSTNQYGCLQYLEIENCPHISRRSATPAGVDLSMLRRDAIIVDGCPLLPNQE